MGVRWAEARVLNRDNSCKIALRQIIKFKGLSRQSFITKGHERYRSYGGCTIFLRSTKTEKLRGPCYITNSLLFWHGGTCSFKNCQIYCKKKPEYTLFWAILLSTDTTVLKFVKTCSRVHVQNILQAGHVPEYNLVDLG